MSTHDEPRRTRFYKAVTVAETLDEPPRFRILLDGRSLRTPAKRVLAVPSRPLAGVLAAEWDAQGSFIDPLSMPMTRLVNSAIDGVAGREAEVRAAILAYGHSDLLCYLAERPEELVARQSRCWGAIHAWAKQTFELELELAVGVMPVRQEPAMLARIDCAIGEKSALALAALHVITTLTGSTLLMLALRHRRITAEDAWSLAHIDEDFQIERWGEDEEAAERRRRRWVEFLAACRMLTMLET